MKCPKCGFVSYPGLAQCKKCGHRFLPAAHQESSSLFSRLFSDSHISSGETAPPSTTPPPSPPGDEAEASPAVVLESRDGGAAPVIAEPAPAVAELLAQEGQAPEARQAWREELAERVESFRRRRARLKHGTDSSANLDLDFEEEPQIFKEPDSALRAAAEAVGEAPTAEARILEFPQANAHLDAELGTSSGAEGELPVVEALPLEKSGGSLRILSSAAVQAGELPLESEQPGGESEPVEILVGSPEPSVQPAAHGVSPLALAMAPMGRRFLAGLADALVLLLGASLFALIFWRAGGRLRLDPLDLAVLAFIAFFFILVYFGLFTALTSSTPGLLWVECEVRNLEGAHPTAQESFLRAFGYVVSISALMLGFLWALLDSEGLTWHDRMSGTFIAAETAKSPALGLQH